MGPKGSMSAIKAKSATCIAGALNMPVAPADSAGSNPSRDQAFA